jgi:hypothetical protein
MMIVSQLPPIYDYFIDFIVQKATPDEILSFQIPESEKQRAIDLLEKKSAGDLTAEESQILVQMQQVDRLISAMKAKALAVQKQS